MEIGISQCEIPQLPKNLQGLGMGFFVVVVALEWVVQIWTYPRSNPSVGFPAIVEFLGD